MHKEFSSGAVVFRRKGKKLLFLLIFSRKNKRWGFPKGHLEAGETEKETAIREIREETGLTDLSFIPGFREEDIYPAISKRSPHRGKKIEKHSVYFLAQTKTASVHVDSTEIGDYAWIDNDAACAMLAFSRSKEILEKAKALIDHS